MSLDPKFLKNVEPLYNPAMGTEKMAPLLYSLICFNRPTSLLEVGAGYTTPFMAKALQDNLQDWEQEKKNVDAASPFKDYYSGEYSPRILCIDNHTHEGSTSSKVDAVMSEIGLGDFVDVVEADFTNYHEQIDPSRLPFDFIWFDCGGLAEYYLFFHHYWQFLNPNGGLMLLHSTLTNLEISTFVKSIKLLQATSDFGNLELLSMLEPHKKNQNSVTMLRKTADLVETIYSIHP